MPTVVTIGIASQYQMEATSGICGPSCVSGSHPKSIQRAAMLP